MKKYKVVPLDADYQDIGNTLFYLRNEISNEFAADEQATLFETVLQRLNAFVYGGPVFESLGGRYQNIRIIR